MLVESVVFHGVVAILIIFAILAIIVFGIVGIVKAIGRGAKSITHRASGNGPGR